MGNNRLHALMLMYVHKNILDNINLADVAHEFVDRKDSRKQTLGRFSQNFSLWLKLRYFSYIYISYQMYITWSCVAFFHSLNRFPNVNDNSTTFC